jgi:hypothetical protein
MPELSGFPAFDLEFNKEGAPVVAEAAARLQNFVQTVQCTDLLVVSHGWNNDLNDARGLYTEFFKQVRLVLQAQTLPGLVARKFAIACVFWPSKKFTEQELIPGGAASFGNPLEAKALRKRLKEMKGFFDHQDANDILKKADALVAKLEASAAARKEFADLLRQLPSASAHSNDDGSAQFFAMPGGQLMKTLKDPIVLPMPPPSTTGGGAAIVGGGNQKKDEGFAAGFGESLSGFFGGGLKLLNYLTFYQMKERAGLVGRNGLNPILRTVAALPNAPKIHLIGHSFGARLVTAALLGATGQAPLAVATLSLWQAAFSHNGFSDNFDGRGGQGFFRAVLSRQQVKGATVISHTRNDRAVALAYPLASFVSGTNAAALGDANDPFGGLGSNGAQRTPEAVNQRMLAVGQPYAFASGKLYNLLADEFISGHSDIHKPEVAYALLSALAKS